MSQPPAGWYPDPDPRTAGQSQRWWDGSRWTDHVQAPYAAPGATAYAGPRLEDGTPLAGWWQRVGAYLIDGIIVSVINGPVSIPLQLKIQDRMQPVLDQLNADAQAGRPIHVGSVFHAYLDAVGPLFTLSVVIGFVISAAYFAGMLRWKGRTVGMSSLGIGVRLADREGQLPWSAIARRVLAHQGVGLPLLIPGAIRVVLLYVVLGLYSVLDVLWPLWDRRNQTLHDKFAGTVVVRRR